MTVAPVGEWESPITSELITASSISLGAPRLSPDGAYVYYLEGRPTEKGRQVLCRQCAPLQHLSSVRLPRPERAGYSLVKHCVVLRRVQSTALRLQVEIWSMHSVWQAWWLQHARTHVVLAKSHVFPCHQTWTRVWG